MWTFRSTNPDSKVHGANVGHIWDRQDPGGPHVGPMNLAIWESLPPNNTHDIPIFTEFYAAMYTGSQNFDPMIYASPIATSAVPIYNTPTLSRYFPGLHSYQMPCCTYHHWVTHPYSFISIGYTQIGRMLWIKSHRDWGFIFAWILIKIGIALISWDGIDAGISFQRYQYGFDVSCMWLWQEVDLWMIKFNHMVKVMTEC